MRKLILFNLVLFSTVLLFSCSESDDPKPDENTEATVVTNLFAPADEMDRETGEIIGDGSFVYFSFEDNQLVPSKDDNWDVGIKGLRMIVNSGISGNGIAEAAVMQGIFEELKEIPEDLELKVDTAESLAIPAQPGKGWYNYNMTTHIVSPVPGNILIFKTNEGNYVKMEVLSYYKDNPPLSEVDLTSPMAYYNFQYVLQPDGSRQF